MTATIPQIFAFIVQFSVAFALVFSYSSMLAVIIFFVTPITLLFGLIIGHKLKVVQKKIQEADALKNAVINESLQNTIILKSFNFLSQNLQKVKMLQNAHFELVKRKNIISIRSNVMLSLGYAFGFFAAIVFGTYGLAIQGISVGTFAAIVQLVGQIQGPMQGVSKGISQYISSLSSVERLQELESLEDEWQMDKNEPQILEKPQKIVLKNVCFAYIKDKPIITNLELTVIKGEKVAIVGPSGEGKTTLILMLLALIEPDNGELFIETSKGERYNMGVNTRSCFSYVPQVNTLFSGSIYDNFLLTSAVSDEELKQALEASCCSEFLDKLPLGLGTEIGERGIGLSQGQAQRVTIARALLHNTPVLIFDEATSALDVGLERRLIENIKKFYPGCTLIAITHREGLFDICDRVYKLKNGRLYSEL
jgi:ABC-type bacteriocin/lantibiotic exporter with double-glycine peptidase domain